MCLPRFVLCAPAISIIKFQASILIMILTLFLILILVPVAGYDKWWCCYVLDIFTLFDRLAAPGGGEAGRPDELHIGGIFPIAGKGGWQGGQACMPAARLALDDVNKQANLLPGFKLILHSNDSEVSTESCIVEPKR